ncbi:MAG: alpha/beta fold hydrolase, partial [Dehalococcoidia bacterium]
VTAREEYVLVDDGARLWTATQGRGRPFVLCHGGPGGTDTLAPVAAMVDDLALVHRYEQRACGRSSGGIPYTMARSVADLEAVRRHWGYDRWLVGGVSFGAALALAYAIEHPQRVQGLVYVSCVVRLAGQPDWTAQFRLARVERIPEPERGRYLELQRRRAESADADVALATEARQLTIGTEFGDPDMARRMTSRLEAELAEVNQEVNRDLGEDFEQYFLAPNTSIRLRSLDCPVLLVHGTADPRPIAAVEALAEALPQARLVRLSGVGHFVQWETPEALRDLLREFITSVT